jgi:hypothetical protein
MNDIPPIDYKKIEEKIRKGDLNAYEKRFLKFTQLMRREFMLRSATIIHKKND